MWVPIKVSRVVYYSYNIVEGSPKSQAAQMISCMTYKFNFQIIIIQGEWEVFLYVPSSVVFILLFDLVFAF